MDPCGRFAPTTSGPAHPGTLLSALLCWLDARSRGARVLLRLEDIDPVRCTPERARDMQEALAWLGLDWDAVGLQSDRYDAHQAALERLAAQGLLYPCDCSRAHVREAGQPAADGGWRYPGTCRERSLAPEELRGGSRPLRLRLEPGRIEPLDEGGLDLSQDPFQALGDPLLRRRDGAIAYHLAVVVDDADQGVTRIVRGRDLAPSTALHCVIQRHLGLPTPRYRHHLLLLEERGDKLAKLHGAVGWHALREHQEPRAVCGWLAALVGLQETPHETTPRALLDGFSWSRVRKDDPVVRWTGRRLEAPGSM